MTNIDVSRMISIGYVDSSKGKSRKSDLDSPGTPPTPPASENARWGPPILLVPYRQGVIFLVVAYGAFPVVPTRSRGVFFVSCWRWSVGHGYTASGRCRFPPPTRRVRETTEEYD